MDAAYRGQDGRVKIVDWKTGSSKNTAGYHDQVAGYALYALDKGWAATDQIDTCLAYLQTPKYLWVTCDQPMLTEVAKKITASADQMLAMAPGGTASVYDFAKLDGPDAWPCRRCNFRRVCW
jgi:hypothetical protein